MKGLIWSKTEIPSKWIKLGALPYSYYHRNFGSILANSYYVGKILYPNKFSDIDPITKADKIYQKFVGKSVHDKIKDKVDGFQTLKLE